MLTNNQKIKLLVIIDFINDITGGTESQLIKIINNLDPKKYCIHLVCLKDSEWIQANKRLLPCNTKTFKIFKLKNLITIAEIILLIRHVKYINPSIVMTFFSLSNILGVFVAKLTGVKVIISTRRDYGLWLNNKFTTLLLNIANKCVSRIIVNSESVKKLISSKEDFDSNKILVVYNGINFKDFNKETNNSPMTKDTLGIPSINKVIGITAGLRPMKRHYTFLQAARLLLNTRTDLTFLVVGDGPLRAELELFTKQYNIQNNIIFTGWQHNIAPVLLLFDLGINCSANEGLSNAIMEYMVFGVPAIVSNAGGNPELIQHDSNGYTFELDHHEELARLILDLLEHKDKQALFAAESKKRIPEMSIERMIFKYDQCFTALLNKN